MGIQDQTLYRGGELLKIVDITSEESTTLSCIRERKEIRNRLCRYKTMDGKEHYTFNTAHPVFEEDKLTAAIDFEEDVFRLEKKQLIEQMQHRAQNMVLSNGTVRKKRLYTLDDFIGADPAILELKKIRKLAPPGKQHPDLRRNRDGQGNPGPEHPRPQPSPEQASGRPELCCHAGKSGGKHPFRNRSRCLHRCHQPQRPSGSRQRRHPVPG